MKKYFIIFLLVLSYWPVLAQPSGRITAGNTYYRQELYAQAEDEYRAALKEVPNDPTASMNLGLALVKQKKYTDAAAIFQRLGSAGNDTIMQNMAWYNLGVTYSKQKKLEESIDAYKNALRRNPQDQNARENLEKALLEQKKQNQSSSSSEKPQMSNKDADQKLSMLQQKERELQQRQQEKNKKTGNGQSQDW